MDRFRRAGDVDIPLDQSNAGNLSAGAIQNSQWVLRLAIVQPQPGVPGRIRIASISATALTIIHRASPFLFRDLDYLQIFRSRTQLRCFVSSEPNRERGGSHLTHFRNYDVRWNSIIQQLQAMFGRSKRSRTIQIQSETPQTGKHLHD